MQTDLFSSTATKVLTVAELTRAIRGTLETRFGAVWVQGEISNYKQHPSGHQYFTLKDSRAQIACVIFRNAPLSLRQPLADGAQVQVYGSVSVFEARGQYQLSVEIVQPRGLGLLQAKFEALKRKLEAEGIVRSGAQETTPAIPEAHRDYYFAKRRSDTRYSQHFAAPRPWDRNFDQSGSGAGHRRGRGNRFGH